VRNFKFSIITVSLNCAGTIAGTINSVLKQTYPNIEYIIVDGASADSTIDIISSHSSDSLKFISEPDNGIYDAINKGIKMATGDIIGILNSDDFFYDEWVLQKIADRFADESLDAVYGDVMFVDPEDLTKSVRYFSSRNFRTSKFKFGYMPAHPSFYVRRSVYEKLGLYKTDYSIAADFELVLRFMHTNKIKCSYIGYPFVCMRTGGVSNRSFLSRVQLNREIAKACRENDIKTNYFNIYSKYITKIFEFNVMSKKI
jgi:glycosyltransferase involved in cell wall biosynthesis